MVEILVGIQLTEILFDLSDRSVIDVEHYDSVFECFLLVVSRDEF